jgi:adenylyl- and sulfurtransferase ThiI
MRNKYYEEYKKSKNKEEFIEILLKKYKNIKKQTAIRRWYDFSKKNIFVKEEKQFEVEPHILKILKIKDMLRYKIQLTREYLKQNGFNDDEINWLISNKYIKKM